MHLSKLCILGAGAWGTALAVRAAAHGHSVVLWSRNPQQVADIQKTRCNETYLPGLVLPAALQCTAEPVAQAVQGVDLVVVASPMAGLRGLLLALADCPCPFPVVWVCKGLEVLKAPSDGQEAKGLQAYFAHEIQAQVAPQLMAGVFSGPSFALEVAQGRPAALVVASAHPTVREAVQMAFQDETLRVYASSDVVGVELGGAVKNILAIATGLCDGLALGQNARAALLTRGLQEMLRLGAAMGGQAQTLMGLSGLGDLLLTAMGDLSRNRQVGLGLAQGQTLEVVLQALGHVAEGVRCVHAVLARAKTLGVEMPIAEAVGAVLQGQTSPRQAMQSLMQRPVGWEFGEGKEVKRGT